MAHGTGVGCRPVQFSVSVAVNLTLAISIEQERVLQLELQFFVDWFNQVVQPESVEDHESIDWRRRSATKQTKMLIN